MSEERKAVVLLSGGLDSTTVLAIAKNQGFELYALTVRYGQLHEIELECARRIAERFGAREHRVVDLDLRSLAVSALTDTSADVPKDRSLDDIGAEGDVPATYVPARNTIMLSLALAWAETTGTRDLFVGVNVLDASGYPDCRPEFIAAFEVLANLATRSGTDGSGQRIRVHAPLIDLTKAGIIKRGVELGVDYAETHSCYDPIRAAACGRCDACQLRRKGFSDAGIPDPTHYHRPVPI